MSFPPEKSLLSRFHLFFSPEVIILFYGRILLFSHVVFLSSRRPFFFSTSIQSCIVFRDYITLVQSPPVFFCRRHLTFYPEPITLSFRRPSHFYSEAISLLFGGNHLLFPEASHFYPEAVAPSFRNHFYPVAISLSIRMHLTSILRPSLPPPEVIAI
jgi:hypothetical protein